MECPICKTKMESTLWPNHYRKEGDFAQLFGYICTECSHEELCAEDREYVELRKAELAK